MLLKCSQSIEGSETILSFTYPPTSVLLYERGPPHSETILEKGRFIRNQYHVQDLNKVLPLKKMVDDLGTLKRIESDTFGPPQGSPFRVLAHHDGTY